MVGVGVDFVFPQEGRRKEGRRNPHLASSRRVDPTCLNFGDCLVGVWNVFGNCLEGVWLESGGRLKGVLRVPGRCLGGVLSVSGGYLWDARMVCGVSKCI